MSSLYHQESFFPLKQCARCGMEKPLSDFHRDKSRRDGHFHRCKACVSEVHHAEADRNYARSRAWVLAHREESLAYHRLYDTTRRDKDTRRRNGRRYNERHKEQRATYIRSWLERNPNKKRMYDIRRFHRKRANGGDFTEREWMDLCAKYGNRCLACGCLGPLHADHVVPLSKGGANNISNIQPLCKSCNSKKYQRTIDYR